MGTRVIGGRRTYSRFSRGSSRPVLLRLAVSLVLVAGVMVAAPSPARAAPTWSVSPSPSPPGPPNGNLAAVACLSETNCYAVGGYFTTSGGKTLVERWNGAHWSIVDSPNPSGSTDSQLSAVSCLNPSSCFAVGSYWSGSTLKTLVERWNGTTWSILDSPNPSGGFAGLTGVSCPIAGTCYAVGFADLFNKTLVERWNGTTWSIVPSPDPSGTQFIALNGVACRTATRCFAVGSFFDGSTSRTLTEHWNGTSWSITPSPNPSGPTSNGLSAVSCPVAGSCYAVGSTFDGATTKTLVEHWNGASWSIVASPNQSGATDSSLSAVSCPTDTRCYAVGSSFADAPGGKTLVELWNGASWSIVASPNPSGSDSFLGGVACSKTASCEAVGSTFDETLVEHWNGASWSIAAPPAGSSQSGLAQVSCPSTASCFAVGSYRNGSAGKTLVEQWNGTTWSIVPSPNPSGPTDSSLNSVSCASTTNCYAVGSYSTPTSGKTLVEQWNGTTWSIIPSPNASGATDSILTSVACPSTTSCFAVGLFFDGSSIKTLVEQWNGTTWSVIPSPNPSGSLAGLTSVSCPTTTNCNAVGIAGFLDETLVEHWDGTSWSIVPSPNPSGTDFVVLNGVSCPSTTNCSAVGSYFAGANVRTLVERWNGATWSIVPSPNPSGPTDSSLNSVSCTSATSCDAVGDFFTGTRYKTLVEHWNGIWSIVQSPNGSQSDDSFLGGVSCPSATSCFAVGGFGAHAGNYTLIERYA